MAHETLRFNLILDENKIPGEQRALNSFDPIYADAHYGTQYGIYANFVGKKVKEGFAVKMIELVLQNYTGAVTIGLVEVLGFKESKADPLNQISGFSSGRLIKLYVVVQALNNKRSISIPCIEEERLNDWNMDKAPTQFIFMKGDLLEVVPVVMPVNKAYVNLDQSDIDKGTNALFADTEYSYRNGETIEATNTQKDKLDIVIDLIDNGLDNKVTPSEKEDARMAGLGGGQRCRQSLSDIYMPGW